MAEDISKRAVLILVMIAVVISILSTTMVLNATYKYSPSGTQIEEHRNPAGRVMLTIPSEPMGTKGTVKLMIIQ